MRKAALITGGAKRLGREIALSLAKNGYDIALHYNSSEKSARETQSEILKIDVACKIFNADLCKESDLIAKAHKEFPGLEVLVNSAAIFEKANIIETSFEILQKHLNINLVSPFCLSRDFAKICKKGNIINILDTRITSNRTTYAAYSISKKAIADFTKLSAVEFAPFIRVNAIAPGLILPPKDQDDDYLDRLAKNIPMKTKGTPGNITRSVLFLLNNNYITGQIIFCDGGEHLK